MDFFYYECRHGDYTLLVPNDRKHWDFLISEMEKCNGATLEQLQDVEWGPVDIEGSYEVGSLSVDDGGRISTITLTTID